MESVSCEADWLTIAEAAELEGISERAIRKRIKTKKVVAKMAKSQNGGGIVGRQWLIDPSTLSAPAKAKWLKKQQSEKRIYAFQEKSAKSGTDEANKPPARDEKPKRAGSTLDERGEALNPAAYRDAVGEKAYSEEMEKARERQRVVEQAFEIKKSKNNVTDRIEALARANGMTGSTLRRLMKKSEEGGVCGLLRKRPTVTQGKRFTSISREVEVIFRKFYQAPGEPMAAAAYRKTKEMCQALDVEIPSRSTIYRFAEHLEDTEPDVCCYTRRGEKAWFEKYAPHAARANPDRVMQVVMGDHHEFDFFINHNGKPVRPWITGFLDVRSRCLVGYTISVQPNGQTINLALAHMMSPKKRKVVLENGAVAEEVLELGGIPEIIYVDRGEDFKAAFKRARNKPDFEFSQESLDLLNHLRIHVTHALPYRPNSKAHIERVFGTFAMQFSRERPGYCGPNKDKRPEGFDERKLLAQDKLDTLETCAEAFWEYLCRQYHATVHSSLGVTPLEKFMAGPKLREGWPDQRTLDMLRTLQEEVHVYKHGIAKFGTRIEPRYYWHEDLKPYVNRNVIIRYDPAHIGELHVFTKEDGYICTAINKELYNWDASQEDYRKINKDRTERKRAIVESMKRNAQTFEEIVSLRKAAGESVICGPTGRGPGLVAAITGLDHTARKAAMGKAGLKKGAVQENRPAVKKRDPIDEYILQKGSL